MARRKKESLQVLFTNALQLLEAKAPLQTIYPILRDATPEVAKLYGNHPGPQIRLRRVEYTGYSDDWHLWTTIPSVDYTHEAQWSTKEPLSAEEDAELRSHMISILQSWLAQDALFSEPIARKEAASRLDISGKTLKRWIEDGTMRVIEMNRNNIRLLKTELPPPKKA